MPWVKGQTGNPGGKNQYSISPEKKLFIAKCQKNWEKAWNILEKFIEGTDNELQWKAAIEILDRGFGKSVISQDINLETNESKPIQDRINELLTDLAIPKPGEAGKAGASVGTPTVDGGK